MCIIDIIHAKQTYNLVLITLSGFIKSLKTDNQSKREK